ncbi:MAG TPA: D-alanyl-D-alanine carboxypeptidase [Solirubrobacteraceae bacterium]|nr:D-alanyl-D-alanine carboxypeptidase [Solirubrobacteraceae bacterium]
MGCTLVVAVAAVTLALLGSFSHTSKGDVSFDAGAAVVGAKHGRASHQRARHRAADPPTSKSGHRPPVSGAVAALQTALTKTMRQAGPSSGALVYDVDNRAELFGLRSTVKRPPASVEKLWTTSALMNKLGPNARLHTTVLGSGSLRHGVWHGNLYLRGGGDPTFGDPTFNKVWLQGYGPTANQLVDQLRARGIRRVTGRVIGDESLFDRRRGGMLTNLLVDVPDFGGQLSALTYDHGATARHYDPASFAARELALTMRSSHIDARASTHTGRAPANGHLLALVSSPPLATMTRLMDVPSDDLFAEMFTKQLGVLFGRGGTIAAGSRVIADTIADAYDLHPTIVDGSGLSRNDRSSPLEVVDLLRDVWKTRVGNELSASLPVVGVQGTVKSIGLKTAAQGHCRAKTGTLNYVTNLAGYCHSRSGKTIAFALFVDGPDNGTAILEESKMIAAIARY